jgi:hypothetical protein
MLRMSALVLLCALAVAAGLPLAPASAQQATAPAAAPPQPLYGPPITLDQAKRVMAAAELEAAKNFWIVAITILDSGGNMVMFHKGDNAQLSAITTSAGKARTALEFKLPSKALDDAAARAQGHHPAARWQPDPGRRQDCRRDRGVRRALRAGRSDRQGRHRRAGEGDVICC